MASLFTTIRLDPEQMQELERVVDRARAEWHGELDEARRFRAGVIAWIAVFSFLAGVIAGAVTR